MDVSVHVSESHLGRISRTATEQGDQRRSSEAAGAPRTCTVARITTIFLVSAVAWFAATLSAAQTTLPPPPQLDARFDRTIDLDFPEDTSAKQAYRDIGRQLGLNIVFAAGLRDNTVRVEATSQRLQPALQLLHTQTGYFHTVLDSTSLLIAPDTPQNRRTFEPLVIQTFYLQYADPPAVAASLRSIVEARKLSLDETRRTITVRDSAARVRLMDNIIARLDHPESEVHVDLWVIGSSRATLSRAAGRHGSPTPSQRLPIATLRGLVGERDARTLESSSVSLVGPTVGHWSLNQAPTDSGSGPMIGIEIELRAEVHDNSGEVTLKAKVDRSCRVEDDGQVRAREVTLSTRLAAGEGLLISGLGTVGSKRSGLSHMVCANGARSDAEQLSVVLIPKIVTPTTPTDDQRKPMWVGAVADPIFGAGKGERAAPR